MGASNDMAKAKTVSATAQSRNIGKPKTVKEGKTSLHACCTAEDNRRGMVPDSAIGKQTTIAETQASLKHVKDALGREQVSANKAAKAFGCLLLSADPVALPLQHASRQALPLQLTSSSLCQTVMLVTLWGEVHL